MIVNINFARRPATFRAVTFATHIARLAAYLMHQLRLLVAATFFRPVRALVNKHIEANQAVGAAPAAKLGASEHHVTDIVGALARVSPTAWWVDRIRFICAHELQMDMGGKKRTREREIGQ